MKTLDLSRLEVGSAAVAFQSTTSLPPPSSPADDDDDDDEGEEGRRLLIWSWSKFEVILGKDRGETQK